MQRFHIGDILTVVTGKLVSPQRIGGVYRILNYMTGDSLYTHQLGRAMNECRPYLLKQHPELESVDASGVNQENWRDWLREQAAKFGESLPVHPIPESAHKLIDPLDELKAMMSGAMTIVIVERRRVGDQGSA